MMLTRKSRVDSGSGSLPSECRFGVPKLARDGSMTRPMKIPAAEAVALLARSSINTLEILAFQPGSS